MTVRYEMSRERGRTAVSVEAGGEKLADLAPVPPRRGLAPATFGWGPFDPSAHLHSLARAVLTHVMGGDAATAQAYVSMFAPEVLRPLDHGRASLAYTAVCDWVIAKLLAELGRRGWKGGKGVE